MKTKLTLLLHVLFSTVLFAQYYDEPIAIKDPQFWRDTYHFVDLDDGGYLVQPYFKSDDRDSSQTVYIIEDDEYGMFKIAEFKFPGWFGLNKFWEEHTDEGWQICSQYPFKALTFCATYDDALNLQATEEYDESEEGIQAYNSFLEQGRICDAQESLMSIGYLHHYWSSFGGCIEVMNKVIEIQSLRNPSSYDSTFFNDVTCAYEMMEIYIGLPGYGGDTADFNSYIEELDKEKFEVFTVWYIQELYNRERYREFEAFAKLVLYINPDNISALKLMGDRQWQIGNGFGAIEYYQKYTIAMASAGKAKEIEKEVLKRCKDCKKLRKTN